MLGLGGGMGPTHVITAGTRPSHFLPGWGAAPRYPPLAALGRRSAGVRALGVPDRPQPRPFCKQLKPPTYRPDRIEPRHGVRSPEVPRRASVAQACRRPSRTCSPRAARTVGVERGRRHSHVPSRRRRRARRSREGGARGGRGRAGRAPAPGGRGGGRVFPGAFPARPSDSLRQETPRTRAGPPSHLRRRGPR